MKRTTIFIDEALIGRLRRFAKREGISSAAVVREAIATYLEAQESEKQRVPKLAGRFESGHTDTSERVDELLWKDCHE